MFMIERMAMTWPSGVSATLFSLVIPVHRHDPDLGTLMIGVLTMFMPAIAGVVRP